MDQANRIDVAGRSRSSNLVVRVVLAANYAQRALANQPWKEYTAEGGRKYWYNTESKQSSWEIPEVYKNALAQTAPTSKLSMP